MGDLMGDMPFVTIAVPCLDEEDHIDVCLSTLQEQDYPRDRMEIVIADGWQRRRHDEDPAPGRRRGSCVRIIDNPERLQAAGLNAVSARAAAT